MNRRRKVIGGVLQCPQLDPEKLAQFKEQWRALESGMKSTFMIPIDTETNFEYLPTMIAGKSPKRSRFIVFHIRSKKKVK